MKKVYTLIAAMLIVSFSFAQIQPRVFRAEPLKIAGKPELKFKNNHDSKTAAYGEWMSYSSAIYAYWAGEPGEDDIAISRVAIDSNGLTHYQDGDVSHGFFFGWGQTFDFTHSVWDDVASEGQLSMNYTNNYNIDSVVIIGAYLRGDSVPAGAVDTLIVAVNTTPNDLQGLVFGNIPVIDYYKVSYDANTHMTVGATLYKIPLTADDVAETTETGVYPSEYIVPINLNGITSKVVNITYSFKRCYTVPMDDDIDNHSAFYAWLIKDPRSNYYPFDNNGNFIAPTEDIYNNHNHGTIISDDNVNHTCSEGQEFFRDYLYPSQLWNPQTHYPYLLAKISCDNCEIVNVPEIEKTNPTVYPNPATNNFTINLGNDEKANIQLFNIVGQQVYSETITSSAQVNVSNLNSGVYMLKISQNGKVYTTKVIVK